MKEAERIREAVAEARKQQQFVRDPRGDVFGHVRYEQMEALISAASSYADYLQPIVHGSDGTGSQGLAGEPLKQECDKGDIVEQVRDVASRTVDVNDHTTLHLAADEIDRLRTPTPAANVIDADKLREAIAECERPRSQQAVLVGGIVCVPVDFNALKAVIEAARSTLPPVCKTKTVGSQKPTMTHFGDPCRHCGTPHDDIEPGACKGDPAKAIPIGYCKLEQRWDGYERFAIRFSDSRIETLWTHPSFHAPYYHFGHSDELKQPPRYDERLKREVAS